MIQTRLPIALGVTQRLAQKRPCEAASGTCREANASAVPSKMM